MGALNFEELKSHQFFNGINFENIRESSVPYQPIHVVRSSIHSSSFVSNFDVSPTLVKKDSKSANDVSININLNQGLGDDDAKFSDISYSDIHSNALNFNHDNNSFDIGDSY